jgi:hypothetical protein
MLIGDAEVATPFFDVSEPVGRTIRVQPAIGRNPVDDDRRVAEDAENDIVVLGANAAGFDMWLLMPIGQSSTMRAM